MSYFEFLIPHIDSIVIVSVCLIVLFACRSEISRREAKDYYGKWKKRQTKSKKIKNVDR